MPQVASSRPAIHQFPWPPPSFRNHKKNNLPIGRFCLSTRYLLIRLLQALPNRNQARVHKDKNQYANND